MDGVHSPHDIAALVPSLKLEPTVARRDQEIIASNSQRFFAGLEQHRVGARGQESANRLRDIGHEKSPGIACATLVIVRAEGKNTRCPRPDGASGGTQRA